MVRSALLLAALAVSAPAHGGDKPDAARSPALPSPEGLNVVAVATTDKRLDGYRAPAGLKVEIVADAPGAVALAFADDGTPIVLNRAKGKSRVVALSVSKKGGPFDTSKTLLEDADAAGLLLHDGWLYVAGGGTVRRYKPSKPGGGFDKKEVIAKGFAGRGHHGVSGLAVGPDGWLYITCGDGDNRLEGSDKSLADLLRSGGVVRCRPDGKKLHVFALGMRNPHGPVAFDAAGNVLHTDNGSHDASPFAGTRLLHVAEGADFGWRLARGKSATGPDPVRASADRVGVMPPMLKLGRGSATGVAVYDDTYLPEEMRGLVLCPDAKGRVVRAYRVEAKGASLRAKEEFELLSAPKDKTFCPCQVVTGPDGAVYVVSCDLTGQGKTGRIYRLRWGGTADVAEIELRGLDSWGKIAALKDAELITALLREDATDRAAAVKELARRGDKNRAALLKVAKDEEAGALTRMGALAALASMYDDDVRAALLSALGEEAEVARLAANLLGLCAKKGDRRVQEALLKALADEDLATRRAVAVAMGRLAGPGAAESLATAVSFDNGTDVYLRDGYLRALEMLGKDGIDALMALADSGVQKDTDKVIDAFGALRTKAAFDAFPTLLRSPHVSSEQAAELIRAAVRYQLSPPASLEPIVTFVAGQKKVNTLVKQALLEVLAMADTAKGDKAVAWVKPMLADDEAATRALAARASLATAAGAIAVGKGLAARQLPRAVVPETIVALRRYAATDAAAAATLVSLTLTMAAPLDAAERWRVIETAWRLADE